MTYTVITTIGVQVTETVEAASPAEASTMASGEFFLCHQCGKHGEPCGPIHITVLDETGLIQYIDEEL